MAKQKVALECLSYHATASQDQTVKLASEPIKSATDYKLYSFKFIGECPSQNETRANDNFGTCHFLWHTAKNNVGSETNDCFIFNSVRVENFTAGCFKKAFTPKWCTMPPKNMLTTFFIDRLRTGGRGNVSRDDKDVCWFQFDFTIPHPVRRKSQTSRTQEAWWLLFNHFQRPCTGSANKSQSLRSLAMCLVPT